MRAPLDSDSRESEGRWLVGPTEQRTKGAGPPWTKSTGPRMVRHVAPTGHHAGHGMDGHDLPRGRSGGWGWAASRPARAWRTAGTGDRPTAASGDAGNGTDSGADVTARMWGAAARAEEERKGREGVLTSEHSGRREG
uniref:Uncharacterized protein n=1 Tax=Oryza sativa subsp. japonica TaxID=39947 RepID=Q6H5D5_ORYSJ|nr:hypothetical protein [Oryza sativa Japonica Group]